MALRIPQRHVHRICQCTGTRTSRRVSRVALAGSTRIMMIGVRSGSWYQRRCSSRVRRPVTRTVHVFSDTWTWVGRVRVGRLSGTHVRCSVVPKCRGSRGGGRKDRAVLVDLSSVTRDKVWTLFCRDVGVLMRDPRRVRTVTIFGR